MRIVVTGASRGIGKGIATFLARHGMQLGLLARSAEGLHAVQAEIERAGGTAVVRLCDLRDPHATQAAVEALVGDLGGVDGLVNNAGLVIRKNVFDLSLDEWHAMVETNVNGLFYTTRAVLPYLRTQGRGHIINISSISGHVPLPGGSAYAATKYAVTGFSDSLFHEVRDYGIKVTTIFPGSVDSDSHREGPTADAEWKVQPEEVGQACRDVLCTAPGTDISWLEIRPLRRPPK